MNTADSEYFRIVDQVLTEGRVKKNRTGIDTLGTFGAQAKFNLADGFPLLTTKKVYFKAIVHELLWFLSGSTNIKYLVDNNVHIWDEWAFARYQKLKWMEAGILAVNPLLLTNQEEAVLRGEDIEPELDKLVRANIKEKQKKFIERIKLDKEFAKKWGELGDGTYGGMWRAFPYHYDKRAVKNPDDEEEHVSVGAVDQISKLIKKLETNPDDRRLIVSAWHPYWVDNCALPPCHCLFQFHTELLTVKERWLLIDKYNWDDKAKCYKTMFTAHDIKDDDIFHAACDDIGVPRRRLNCQLYQRSCDLFLGVPFNIASYALLTHLIAHVVKMEAGSFTHSYGDLHIYTNHLDQIETQMKRSHFPLPKLELNPDVKSIFDFDYSDIHLEGYQSHPAIKGEVAV